PVDGRGEELGRAGRGPEDHLVADVARADEQLLAQSGEPGAHLARDLRRPWGGVATLAGHRIHELASTAHLDRVEVHQVAGQGGLGDGDPVLGQQVQQVALRADGVPLEQLRDALVPGGTGHGDRAHAAGLYLTLHEYAVRYPISSRSNRRVASAWDAWKARRVGRPALVGRRDASRSKRPSPARTPTTTGAAAPSSARRDT